MSYVSRMMGYMDTQQWRHEAIHRGDNGYEGDGVGWA